ncbi:hypothetical protein [Methanosarcina lacustris]|nr:hypothetical protein [Methanosarcina lacustris]
MDFCGRWIAGIARGVVEKHDVRHIRTLHTKDGRNCEIWYYVLNI